jgi:hypothetical protein
MKPNFLSAYRRRIESREAEGDGGFGAARRRTEIAGICIYDENSNCVTMVGETCGGASENSNYSTGRVTGFRGLRREEGVSGQIPGQLLSMEFMKDIKGIQDI